MVTKNHFALNTKSPSIEKKRAIFSCFVTGLLLWNNYKSLNMLQINYIRKI